MKNTFLKLLALGAMATASANAAIDVSGVTLDVTPVEAIGATILGALAVIWVARKVVGFFRA